MSTRIRPAKPDQWDEQAREILGRSTAAADAPDGLGPPNILYTIAHHPRLLQPFLGFTATLATAGVLPRRDSELLALRTAWNCRSAFEWGHHVEYASAEGISPDEIEQVIAGPDHPAWSGADRLLVRAADELHAGQSLSDTTFEALRDALSDAQIVELTFVVGNYTMLSMVANATGVPLEERLPPMPSVAPLARAEDSREAGS
jgi:4-carboxymuconolactone decarboxylase